ncbi:MAG: DNA polymerase III subunit beta [Acidobacteriota bacterium]
MEKNFFSNELKLFQGVFEKKTLIDILQNIKITAFEDGKVELLATDLEIGLSSVISVKVEEPGTFTVNGRDFYDLISKMPEGLIEIGENNDLQITITNEKKTSKYKLMGLQSSDYPQLPEADFSNPIILDIKKLGFLINKSHFIISHEMKFNLGGALLTITNSLIEMASTDGHRLSYSFFDHNMNIDDQLNFIISRKSLMELLKIGDSGSLEFTYDKNNLFFKSGNRILSSRIIDQKFPNYKTVIPENTQFEAVLYSEELLTTLKRILIFKSRNNGVIFKFEENKLILERTTPEKGEAYDEVEMEYSGKPINIAFNGNFIIDFLSHLNSEKLRIKMNDTESSFIFEPFVNEDEGKFIYVVMPLNI